MMMKLTPDGCKALSVLCMAEKVPLYFTNIWAVISPYHLGFNHYAIAQVDVIWQKLCVAQQEQNVGEFTKAKHCLDG